jgi:hypothetical protein
MRRIGRRRVTALASWLRENGDAVPPRLAARIAECVGAAAGAPGTPASDSTRALDAADALLRDLLARESEGRGVALDLLTVDALVTFAFESAADDATSLRERANAAALRFAGMIHP